VPGRSVLMLVVIAGLFGGAWYGAWLKWGGPGLSSEDYLLTDKKVEVTPPPDWIHTDICAQVFRDASLDPPLSITDDALVQRLRSAFALHPWVAKVERVEKFHPARVKVDLVYRRPVCMVEIAGELTPVDAEGVVLPREDFTAPEASRYPRLAGIDSAPLGVAGARWGDDRVLGGAEIAAALVERWETLGLKCILVSTPPGIGLRATPTFALLTRGGSRILWGRGPMGDAPGENPIQDKIARLERYMADHGSLESQPGGVGLDLSRPQPSVPTGPAGPLIPLPQRKD